MRVDGKLLMGWESSHQCSEGGQRGGLWGISALNEMMERRDKDVTRCNQEQASKMMRNRVFVNLMTQEH